MDVDIKEMIKIFEAKPMCLIVIGMAGSGKTSFVKALSEYLCEYDKTPYLINIDPAVSYLPYAPNIDIRDSISYKDVMKDYHLGPNGAILTSLNLFSTEINELVGLIEKNSPSLNYVIIDTPGQIEVFKWSASGKIITESLSSSFPTTIVYVIDCVKCTSPVTFMSNMLYASGVAVENELPFVIAMNKNDIISCDYLDRWMSDVTSFIDDMENYDCGYMTSMTSQLAMALDIFYIDLKRCGVSSYTGDGLKEFASLLKLAREEFFNEYLENILPDKLSVKADLNENIFIDFLNEPEVQDSDDDDSADINII